MKRASGADFGAIPVHNQRDLPILMSIRTSVRLALTAAALAAATSAQAYTQIVAFGDSLSDNGNLFELTAQFNAATPVAPYFDGRFSNGPVAVEVMAQQLGLSLDDRAYGGATTGTGNKTATPILNATGMTSQVQRYLSEKSNSVDAQALYFVWGGANDIFQLLDSDTPVTPESVMQVVMRARSNYHGIIRSLDAAGAQHFFLPTLPNLAATGLGYAGGPSAQYALNQISSLFNQNLVSAANSLEAELGVDITLFDVEPSFLAVSQQILAAGGTVSLPCWTGNYSGTDGTLCADPDKHVLFDKVHPTAYAHNFLGQQMAAAVPEPGTWALSFTGLLAVGALARRRQAAAVKPAPVSCS